MLQFHSCVAGYSKTMYFRTYPAGCLLKLCYHRLNVNKALMKGDSNRSNVKHRDYNANAMLIRP